MFMKVSSLTFNITPIGVCLFHILQILFFYKPYLQFSRKQAFYEELKISCLLKHGFIVASAMNNVSYPNGFVLYGIKNDGTSFKRHQT